MAKLRKINNLLILGAGTDKSKGLDIPLAQELIKGIRDFLSDAPQGLKIDKLLRSFLKDLKFSYNNLSKEAVDQLLTTYETKKGWLLEIINKESNIQQERDYLNLVKYFLEQESLNLDIEEKIRLKSEEIIKEKSNRKTVNLKSLKTTSLFRRLMERLFEIAIYNPDYKILNEIYNGCIDFEMLLLKYFIGFYNGTKINIKKYLYVSWTLWAFFCWKEKKILASPQLPFYDTIKKADGVITLNYPSFAMRISKNHIYFHGELKKYINLNNRMIETIKQKDYELNDFLKNTILKIIDFSKNSYIIPSIIPPFKMKPVLSKEFIDIWHNASKMIEDAETLIIVGYSFNPVDDHFNDIIRKDKNIKEKKIFIINPDSKTILSRSSEIFGYEEKDFILSDLNGKISYTKNNLTIIKAGATDINIDNLFEMATISPPKQKNSFEEIKP